MTRVTFVLLILFCVAAAASAVDKPKTETAQKHTIAKKPVTKAVQPASVADTTDDSSHVLVRIQRQKISGRPINDTILVTLQTSARKIGGFDLKIASTSPFVRIVNILKGEIVDSCHWEYFSAKEMPVTDSPGRPRSVWQAVALAQTVSDPKKPKCFGFDREASILKVVVSNSHVLQMPDTSAALFFWWEDCTDNVLSGESGEQLFMSLNILDYYAVDIEETEGVFPNHKGALRQCVNPRSANKPMRLVVFHNGGLEWRADGVILDSL